VDVHKEFLSSVSKQNILQISILQPNLSDPIFCQETDPLHFIPTPESDHHENNHHPNNHFIPQFNNRQYFSENGDNVIFVANTHLTGYFPYFYSSCSF